VGEIDGRAKVTTQGNSIAAMLGAADGDAVLLMNSGEISDLLLRLTNLDLANAAASLLKGDKNIRVRCRRLAVPCHKHLRPFPFKGKDRMGMGYSGASLLFLYVGPRNLYAAFTSLSLIFIAYISARNYVMDIVYVLLTLGFFALSIGFIYGCERLRNPS
jgi:hypothetical protein